MNLMLHAGWITLLLALPAAMFAADSPIQATPAPAVDYVIVVTGGELLEGAYPDGHTHFLTRTLRPLGCRCVGSVLVDDRREDMLSTLRYATQRASLVIVTGGLGPTPNDITREVLSEFTDIGLQENAEALAEMERRFQHPREQMRSNLRRQTLTPQRGRLLKNAEGTAVGLIFESDRAVIVALPGPPRELQPMVQNELVPYLQRHYGVRPLGASLTLRFVGAGQSLIDQTIKDHIPLPPEVVITSTFDGGRVDFSFTVPGHMAEDQARLKRIEPEIARHLGQYLYANDGASLEEKVLQQIRRQATSLVLVEIGSGGHLATSLNRVAQTKDFLKAAYFAPTEQLISRLLRVSEANQRAWNSSLDRIKGLAAAARKEAQSDWVIATGAVERAEKKVPAIWVAFGPIDGEWVTHQLPLRNSSETAYSQLITQILDRVRQQLQY